MYTSWLNTSGLVAVFCLYAALPSFASHPGRDRAADEASDEAADEVRRALTDLDEWLGQGTLGDQWRQYLSSGELRSVLDAGGRPDREGLAAIHARYTGSAAGLEMRRFAAVRTALESWLAQMSPWAADELPAAVRDAKERYVPTTAADVSQAKSRLAAALARLDRELAGGGARGRGWAEYLERDELQTQLQADVPDVEVLSRIHDRFVGHYEGLELSWLGEVRQALRAYGDRVAALQNVEGQAAYQSLIGLLADALQQHSAAPSPEKRELIAYIVGQFERYGLAPEVTRAVRYHFSQPNFLAHASTHVIAAGIARPVDDVTEVHDMILGTSIHGTGRTRGQIYVEMVPHPNQAMLDVMLRGTTTSDTVGYNGPVQVYATGLTNVSGRKRLVIDADGVRGLPATAAARTRSNVHGLSTSKRGLVDRIVRKVAWKQVWQKKSQSEYVASRRAEERIRDRMNDESHEFIADADRGFHEKFLFPLRRQNVYPEQLRFSTTLHHLHVVSLQAGLGRLGAPTEPPKLTESSDLAVRVHESMANNLAKDLLGGLTLTQTRVRDISQKLSDDPNEELPDWLVVDEEKGPWSITFEEEDVELGTRPVTVRFGDGGFRFTIHGTGYVVDGLRHATAMDITAVYRFESTADGWRAVRQGKPLIFPPGFDPRGDQTLSVQETALKGNMENRFDDIFKAEFDMDNFQLPGEWADAGVFRLRQVQSEAGWLTLAWRRVDAMAGPGDHQAAAIDTPSPRPALAETGFKK